MANPSTPPFASAPIPPPVGNLRFIDSSGMLTPVGWQFLQELWAAIQGDGGIINLLTITGFSSGLSLGAAQAVVAELATDYALAAAPPGNLGALLNAAQEIALRVQRPPATPIVTPGPQLWTPTLAIGGASTSITYSLNAGTFEYLTQDTLRVRASIALTSMGALTGAVTIAGLPLPLGVTWGSADGAFVPTFANFSSLTGPLFIAGVAASASLDLVQGTATGAGPVTNTNLTNTSSFQFAIDISV